jgi:hypothetical protein
VTLIERQPRPRAPLGEDGRARMEQLLRARQLSGYDRGVLRALGRQGSLHDQERVAAKLGGHRSGQQPVTQRQANSLILRQVRAAVDQRLADDADDLS